MAMLCLLSTTFTTGLMKRERRGTTMGFALWTIGLLAMSMQWPERHLTIGQCVMVFFSLAWVLIYDAIVMEKLVRRG